MTATATRTAIDTTDLTLTVELPDGTEVPALTTAQLSTLTGISGRALRRAFRKAGHGVGKGSIYATPVSDAQRIVDGLRTR